MSFHYDRELDAAIDPERGAVLRSSGGAHSHMFFEITLGSEVWRIAAIEATREPTPEEKALFPSLPYVGIWNVLAGPDLSDDRRSLIHEGLAVWEANWRGGETRPAGILFNDVRYEGD